MPGTVENSNENTSLAQCPNYCVSDYSLCVSFQKVQRGFATSVPPFANTYPSRYAVAYTARFFFFMSLAEWKQKSSLPVTRSQGATPRSTHLEKLSLNFSGSSFEIRAIFSILNHPCSFMVYYYLFGVFLS